MAILRAAGLIDARNRWIGKKAVLVQTGDVTDRGPDSRKAIDLLRKLEGDAQRAGGRVYALLGNHELMRLVSDWRYVSQGETDAFKNADSIDLRERAYIVFSTEAEKAAKAVGKPFDPKVYREQFMKEVPLGSLEMRFAFDAKGEYGAWVRQRAAVARINGILFLHGGISDAASLLGCDGINAAVRKDLLSLPVPLEQVPTLFSAGETGPLWYRGLANEPEAALAPTLDLILERMRARAIVIGHTTVLPGRINARFGGPRHSDRHRHGERGVLSWRSRLGSGAAGRQDDRDLSRSPRAAHSARAGRRPRPRQLIDIASRTLRRALYIVNRTTGSPSRAIRSS